jgi:trehalose 6-phosphate phosphatase
MAGQLRAPTAVVFDLDGVLVDTARLHAMAWQQTFDRFFSERGIDDRFDRDEDYRRHVDGKPRYEGVASLLRSRGIEVPRGDPEDRPGLDTRTAIGNLKNELFNQLVDSEGVTALPGVRPLLEALRAQTVPMALVSSSRNARRVLPIELSRLLDVQLDGTDLGELGVPGKPDPAMFHEAARRMGVPPRSIAVIEDAPAGVAAGRAGGFGLVVGIGDPGHHRLSESGADVVVTGVGDLPLDIEVWPSLLSVPAPALDSVTEIVTALGAEPALFLDYDGTLTPIVADPAQATIDEGARELLRRLASRVPLAIVSGRGLSDVREMVGVDGITYGGSHGFEIDRPGGRHFEHEGAVAVLADLDAAQTALEAGVAGLDGVRVERKRFAIAVHTRLAVNDDVRQQAGELTAQVAAKHPTLTQTGGKEIHELRPNVDWDKGAALAYLLELMPASPRPLYIGDDSTDEDAFLRARVIGGIGIRVGEVGSGADTWADYLLDGPEQTIALLESILDAFEAISAT